MPSIHLLTSSPEAFSQLVNRLRQNGNNVESGSGADQLIQALEQAPVDLVLLDSDLPDGYSICRNLKDTPHADLVPVILVHRQENSNGSVAKGLQAGAEDVVSVTALDEAVARIDAALRLHRRVSQCQSLAQQLTQMNSELYERNLRVEKELYITRQLQQSLLPPFLKDDSRDDDGKTLQPTETTSFSKCHYKDDRLRITGLYLPCDALGGDIYDVIKFQDGTLGVAIADVSGHGVPAGFITAIFKSSLYRASLSKSKPSEIVFRLNNELNEIVKTGEYVTAVYCRISQHEDGSITLEYTGAGHPYPIYYQASTQSVERLQENGTPLVWIKNMDYPSGSVRLNSGDKLLLFTDGVSEMRSESGELFGEERLEKMLAEHAGQGTPQVLEAMIQTLSDFAEGHPLEDDLSMVLIEAL